MDRWVISKMNTGFWTADNERWYQRRLKEIRRGDAQPHTSQEWNNLLGKSKVRATQDFYCALDKLAEGAFRGENVYV